MDEREIRNAKAAVKKTQKIVRDYVAFLETTLANQYRISALAVAKMRELAAIEKQARAEMENEPN